MCSAWSDVFLSFSDNFSNCRIHTLVNNPWVTTAMISSQSPLTGLFNGNANCCARGSPSEHSIQALSHELFSDSLILNYSWRTYMVCKMVSWIVVPPKCVRALICPTYCIPQLDLLIYYCLYVVASYDTWSGSITPILRAHLKKRSANQHEWAPSPHTVWAILVSDLRYYFWAHDPILYFREPFAHW